VKWVLSVFFILPFKTYAQSLDSVVHELSIKFQYTSIWTERTSLRPFTQDHPWSVQIDWGITHNSKKSWSYCNCYTQNGLSVGYINFSDPTHLGQAMTFAAFTEPYIFRSDRFSLSVRGGTGLAFLNKLYDSTSNREAIFFSTKMSYLLSLGINVSYRLSDYFYMKASAQLNHISNGGRKDPNEGMNFPGGLISLNYVLSPKPFPVRLKEKFTHKPLGVIAHAFGSTRTAQATSVFQAESRLVLGLNLGLMKRIGRMNGLAIGGEYYYDGINEVYHQRTNQLLQTIVGGLNLQHYLFLGKLLFGQQVAWYLTPNTGFQNSIYQRYFLEYEVKKNWYAGFTLKAHGDHSDYFAFATGYFFKLN
jgi:hypothetical protein